MTRGAQEPSPRRLAWAAFFCSAGLLGFELALMRVLLVASWHHVAFLIVSVVLLGFGASGTALSLFRGPVIRHGPAVLLGLILLSAITMPACMEIAQRVSIDAQLLPAVLWRQLGGWAAYWMVLSIPVFLGAMAIGLALMLARHAIAGVYAANLLGSAFGSVLLVGVMALVPPEWLVAICAVMFLVAGASLLGKGTSARTAVWLGSAVVVLAGLALRSPSIRMDSLKFGAYVQRLVDQREAVRAGRAFGPRGVVEAYGGASFHDLPFLTGELAPPPLSVLLSDGHYAGSVLDIVSPRDAALLDGVLTAFPYSLATSTPRVLLLGEAGGVNIWTAARRRAATITVVQSDPNVAALLRGPLRDRGGAVLDLAGVELVNAEPRHVVDHSADRFDLIQLAALESTAAGAGGIGGLAQDPLATVEGFASCLRRLTDDGLLTVTRGIQTPPRDNLKILATVIAALRRGGVADPRNHVIVVRDFLAVCTVAKRSPWSAGQIERVRSAVRERGLTPVWFPGIREDELNQPDALPGPPDSAGDWYSFAVQRLFGEGFSGFLEDWPFYIEPATDDRPFFHDFCKLRSLPQLKQAFGDVWLTRAELGFLFVVASMLLVAVAAAALLILPLLLLRRTSRPQARSTPTAYFLAIGLGFMIIEMTFLSRMTHWIGDSVIAAACTFTGFLMFSGLGSLAAQRAASRGSPATCLTSVVVMLVIVGLFDLAAVTRLGALVGSLPLPARCLAGLTVMAPLAFLMGFPMPLALARLNEAAPDLVPWCWAVNGFASVLASPLSLVVGMTWGFTAAGLGAVALYLVPLTLFDRLPRVDCRSTDQAAPHELERNVAPG